MDTMEKAKINNQLCFPLYLASKEITRIYNEKLKPFNLTYTQYIVMLYLWEVKSSNLKEMAKALMLDSSTLTPILKKLEIKGFVLRARSAKDERNLCITLTKQGEQLQDALMDIPKQVKKYCTLSPQEAQALQKMTIQMVSDFRKQDK